MEACSAGPSRRSTRNYRLFYVGQTISVVTWMQRVAQDWLILELGGGAVGLAIGLALQSGPVLLLSMWGGVISDRYDTRKVLLVCRNSSSRCWPDPRACRPDRPGHVAAGVRDGLPAGRANVIDKPAPSFVLELVGTKGAANAVSLNSSINNAARLIGPAVAGVVIGVSGTGVAFLLNALTFAAIIVALLLMDPTSFHPRELTRPRAGR